MYLVANRTPSGEGCENEILSLEIDFPVMNLERTQFIKLVAILRCLCKLCTQSLTIPNCEGNESSEIEYELNCERLNIILFADVNSSTKHKPII